jgi:hypothetical protein
MANKSSFAHLLSFFTGSHTENVEFFIAQLKEIASLEVWSEQKKFFVFEASSQRCCTSIFTEGT